MGNSNLDLKVRVKVKKLDKIEYDAVMNVWRACMLFFERELRKMNDRGKLSTNTLRKIANNIDFTELVRLNLNSIPESDRMKLVKLDEVSEALQRMQNLPRLKPEQQTYVNSYASQNQQLKAYTQYEKPREVPTNKFSDYSLSDSNISPPDQQIKQSIQKNETEIHDVDQDQKKEDTLQEHLKLLQKDTATAVVELRRMMYENLQRLRQSLKDDE